MMRLLITTQSVDRNDPILGFFHGWLLEFAKHFEQIHVICLREGEHALPSNVHVYSLGKEESVNYVRYVWRLFSFAWTLRGEYNVIFSHMNPHYIVVCGWLWAILHKPMYFWRNHAQMNWMTKVAARFARRVFYTSPFACTRVFPHALQMPVGIDTKLFAPLEGMTAEKKSILFFGRLSPVKRPELFIRVANMLPEYRVSVYGDVQNADVSYGKQLRSMAGEHVHFFDAVSNREAPAIYRTHEIYVNLTPEGSMDKTVLEAASCGALVVVTNTSFAGMVPDQCVVHSDTPEAITERIRQLAEFSPPQKEMCRIQLQTMVKEMHSLEKLMSKLKEQFEL